jgi:prevent-host-death family protein
MTRLSTSQLREELSEALNRVAYRGERIVLRRHGKDVAALVPMDDLARLEEMEDRADNAAADAALKEIERTGTVAWQQVRDKERRRE